MIIAATNVEELERSTKAGTCATTDLGNAERLVATFGREIRYCTPWRKWLIWDGTRWLKDETGEAMRYAKDVAVSIFEEAKLIADDDKRKRLMAWCLQSQGEYRLRAMLSLAESEAGIPVLPKRLDANPWLLNTPTGTVNLELGSVSAHFRPDLITKMAGAPYHGEQAECPLWIEFLDRIFDGNTDLISFIQQAVGYSLTGITREQCLFILYGLGANGKSTFLEVLRSVFGDYALASAFSTFLVSKNDAIRNDLARLAGARLVTAVEAEAGGRLSESVVKQLTGGDVVTARFLHREFFEFIPTHKPWLAANHKPTIRGTDTAIWRRIRLIPFTVTIPPEEQDRELPEKLRKEAPGILQWAIEGCLAWQEAGTLEAPKAVRQATAAYKAEMDTLATFLEERCLLSPNAHVKAKDLYATYKAWCQETGEYCMSQTKLGRTLAERGFDKGRPSGGATQYSGLCLREPVGATWKD